MAVIQDININVHGQPSEKRLQTFLRLSQNENGRMINFRVLGSPLPSGCTATFAGTKPDGNVYSTTGTVTGNFVVIQEDMQMTAVAGVWDAKLDIVNGVHNIMSALIRVTVERDVVDPDAIASDSELQGLVAECKGYAEHARTDAYGSPLTATTAAEMTDKTRVYVYTGSETGMTAGNWYYWNGSAWTSGGVYNAVAVQTDTTLSVAGKPADGKATGDAVAELNEDLNALDERVEALEEGESGGLTANVKSALLACFRGVAWVDDDGNTLYTNLVNALDNNDPQYTYYNVGQTLTNVTSSYTSVSIRQGNALTAILYPTSGYEINSVSVSMGGTDITSTAYDSSTNTVSIASVTADVVITATAVASHVQNGLLYRWVGEDLNGTAWTDRKSNAVINLANVTKNGKALVFNGSSAYGLGLFTSGITGAQTVEVILQSGHDNLYNVIITPAVALTVGSVATLPTVSATKPSQGMRDFAKLPLNTIYHATVTYSGTFEPEGYNLYLDAEVQTVRSLSQFAYITNNHEGIELGATFTAEGDPNNYYFYGNIYEIRIYNRVLTAEEIAHNHSLDADNYGIGV